MHGTLTKRLGLVLLALALAMCGWWLMLRSSAPTPEVADASQAALDRVAERTRRESLWGADQAQVQVEFQGPPSPSKQASARVKAPESRISLPPGYALADHLGAMKRAPLTDQRTTEPAPNPGWLEAAVGLEGILQQPRAHAKVFAVLRLAQGASIAHMNESLTRLGASVQGASGDTLRIRVAPDRAILQAIAELPGVLGIGALPAAAKYHPSFDERLRSAPPGRSTPVFITLMGDDASGRWKQAMTELGVMVGAYDADLQSYVANLPASALLDLASADYVMQIDPIEVVTATHGSAVPVMGVDGLRRYDFSNESFAGLTGQGIAVGVLDSGLNLRHADIGEGRESICGANFVTGQNWDLWADYNGHGTHVFGTIAGSGRIDALRAGMAPNLSHLRFAKVLDFEGFGTQDDIRRGMDYMSRPSACPERGASAVKPMIVNMSLSSSSLTASGRGVGERKIDAIVHSQGQLYVVAQSNEDVTGFSNYGTAKNALAVGAVHDSGRVANFSSHGPTGDGRLAPKVVGTGVEVWSARGQASRSGYHASSGTSMASPSVAGVAALLLESHANLRGKPALARAQLMASAVRPDPYLTSSEQFPLDNSQGPGAMQHQYGMGLVSARSSIASLPRRDGWQVASAEASPEAGNYEYVDLRVPEGASRLDLVMTWDEGPADTLTSSVLNNLDLWLDQGADCGEGACGEHASRSKVDNVEWIIVPAPTPGTHRVKIVPVQVYGEDVKAAIAWKIIRGEPTPQLSIEAEEIVSATDPDQMTIRLSVHTSSYLAAGTTLHLSCSDAPGADCHALDIQLTAAEMRIIRNDGLTRLKSLENIALSEAFSIGEVAPEAPRTIEIPLNRSALPQGTPLHVTASAWNALAATETVLLDTQAGTDSNAAPANDRFEGREAIAGMSGEVLLDLSMASREPGEPGVQGNTRSLWFAWQAPASGLYRFGLTRNPGLSSRLEIFTGDAITTLTSVASRDGNTIAFSADQGTHYLVRVSSRWGITPRMSMTWEAADVRPANDDFDKAMTIPSENNSVNGSNKGATLEQGEFWGGLAASTWHAWTAPSDGPWCIDVDQSLAIMVFAGESLDALRMLSQPRPDRDAIFLAIEGRRYRFAVASLHADASGTAYELSLHKCDLRADFDHFQEAGTLHGSEGSLSSPYSTDMTAETDEPPETGIGTRWWQWRAPENGRFTFSLDGSNAILLNVFTGDHLRDLSLVAAGSAGTPIVLDAEAERIYHIALGRSAGSINISETFLERPKALRWGPTPENDERQNASLITGAHGNALVDMDHATEAPDEPLDNIGHESLWWQWSAPSSGWHRFTVENDPDWAIVSIYPASEDGNAHLHPLASSERSYLASGRIEAAFLARAGEQYQIRVAMRPSTERSGPAKLNWERISAPAYLAYLGAHTSSTDKTEPSHVRWQRHNLAMHADGRLVFTTLNERLLALERDLQSGELTPSRSLEADAISTNPKTDLKPRALSESTLWWSRAQQRLFAFHNVQSNAFSPPAAAGSAWSRTLVKVEGHDGTAFPVTHAFAASSDDRFLYFASSDSLSPVMNVYRVDSGARISQVQSLSDLIVQGLGEVGQVLITPDDAYLMAASERRLLIFAIDTTSGQLTLTKEIPVGGLDGTPLADMQALKGLVLNSNASLLFASGRRAPHVAVFDVSAGYADPVHLHTLTAFPEEPPLTLLDRPSTGAFQDCGRAYAHASKAAIDIICEYGHFVTLWDAAEKTLRVTDYGLSSQEDRFGQIVPPYGNHQRHSAQSPDGGHLYRTAHRGNLGQIHLLERASAMTVDTSGNHAPSINRRLENQVATVGAAFFYQVPADTFVDADGDQLTLSATPLPAWLSFDATTQSFTGTPFPSHVTFAPAVITVMASDHAGASTSLRFSLEVRPEMKPNSAPLVESALPAQTAKAGETFAFEIPAATFRDPDGDTLAFSVSNVPAWLDFDATTRILTGTPAKEDAGKTFTITVSVADGMGSRAETTLTITVEAQSAPLSFELSSQSDRLSEWDYASDIDIELELTEAPSRAQSFDIVSAGSAEAGADFTLRETEVSVAAGSRSARFSLAPLLDFNAEGEETITLRAEADDGSSASLSLALEDAGTLFADAKSELYGDLYVFFGDRKISAESIEFEVLVYNLGADSTSSGTFEFWVSRSANLLPPVGARSRAQVPEISAGRGISFKTTVELASLASPGPYYAIARVSPRPEELPGRAYTNEDVTGFTLAAGPKVVTTCPDLERNTSPGSADPLAAEQWHIDNTGQSAFAASGGVAGEDLDMQTAMSAGRAGQGVKVAVVDTGLEICHPDLEANVETNASFNFNASAWAGVLAADPYFPSTFGDHGTSVAGLIASVANNGIGGRGVATQASLRGYNFLEAIPDTAFNSSLGASATNPDSSDVDIFNMSFGSFGGEWTSTDDQVRLFRHGATSLRNGKGAIYIKAGGNGFGRCSSMQRIDPASNFNINNELGCVHSNADPNTNIPYLINVGGLNATGKRASYSASGSALWVAAPAGEYGERAPAMVTTDQMGADTGYDALNSGTSTRTHGLRPGAQGNPQGDYVSTFNGTSSAAPNVSGVVAILLAAYPELTWRDVKHLLARSARKVDPDTPAFEVALGGQAATLRHAWITNDAGYEFHNWYGFGAVSVDSLLAEAANHEAGSLGLYTPVTGFSKSEPVSIPDNSGAGVRQTLLVEGIDHSRRIESVTLDFKITHPFTSDLGIMLISPAGTESILLPVYSETLVNNEDLDWRLLSNAFYGESPSGDWTIQVIDAAAGDVGKLESWSIKFALGEVPAKK